MSTKKIMARFAELKIELGIISTIIGALFTIFAIYGGPNEYTPEFLVSTVEAIGNWHLYMWVVGPLMFLMGIWYVYDTRKKRKEFETFMETTSRAKFSSSIHEIESLAWHLKRKDRERVAAKKKELKIK